MVNVASTASSAAAALTLLGFRGSSTTNRIRLALAIKDIPYTFEEVDLGAANIQRTDEFRTKRNRLGQIPILYVGDVPLRQSVACLEYLEEAYPDSSTRLLPDDPIERAKVREIVEIVNSFIQPMQNKLTVEKIAEMDQALAEWLPLAIKAHVEGNVHENKSTTPVLWPHWWIQKGFDAIENLIEDDDDGGGGGFCFGQYPTFADCALVPQTIGAIKYQLDMSPYSKIMRVYKKVLALDAVKKSMSDVVENI